MYLELIEKRPGQEPTRTQIEADQLPATVGRGSTATYPVGRGAGEQAPTRILSRTHATIYSEDGGVWLRDGHHAPSNHGCYVGGKRIVGAVRLYEGIEVDLLPEVNGWRVWVQWRSEYDGENFPTVEEERDALAGELRDCQEQIVDLQQSMEVMGDQLFGLDAANRRQDKRLRLIRVVLIAVAIGAVAAAWVVLGGDASTVEDVIGVVVLVVSLGGGGIAISGRE